MNARVREPQVLISEVGPRDGLQAGLPGEPIYGVTPEAGLPKGWVQGVYATEHGRL